MMGPLIDQRVEAVAGAPVLDVRAPLWSQPVAEAGTAVFVGRLAPRNPPVIQVALWGVGNHPSIYWREDLSFNMLANGSPKQLAVPGGMVAFSAEFPAGARRGLGLSSSTAQYFAGPFRAVAFDHALTIDQAAEIARRLAVTL